MSQTLKNAAIQPHTEEQTMSTTQTPHATVRMVETEDGSYRRCYLSEVTPRLRAGRIRLEGMDADEEANTVTYWYCRSTES